MKLRLSVAFLLLASSVSAQLVLDRYPGEGLFIPKQEEEEPKEEPKRVYQGDIVFYPSECRRSEVEKLGLLCSEESPCELYFEPVDVREGGEGRIYLIANLATASSGLAAVVLVSEDQGATWTDAAQRISAASVERMAFSEDDFGWIAGQAAGQSVSQAPFLLATDDGGKNWTRYGIWAGKEERSGAVLDLYFDSPDHGFLLIERRGSGTDPFELYETVTSGTSWNIKEIMSERPRIRRRRTMALGPEWRIGENEQYGIYEIQRLEGGSWKKVASFAAALGPCAVIE